MGNVRGPFLEYECHQCGHVVKESAPRNDERLVDRIADLNNEPEKRICACCWSPLETQR